MTSAGTDRETADSDAAGGLVEPAALDLASVDDAGLEKAAAAHMRRLHPLTPFLRSWRLVGAVSAAALGIFREDLDRVTWVWHAIRGDFQLSLVAKAALITLGVAMVIVFGGWLSWRATGFAIVGDRGGSGTLLFHRGVLAKQRNQVRLDRVQSVDVNRPLVPRLLGLAAVRLDMAAGEEASVDLAYLPFDEATALREDILRHTGGAGADEPLGEAADPAPQRPSREPDLLLARVSTEQVIKSNLLDGITAWIVLVVWVIAAVVAAVVMGWAAFLAALSAVVPITIAIVAQLRRQVGSMMRDADFKLFRTPTGVRVSSGLTSTVNRTIDFDRIQGVRLVEPFWWRRFGWARVKLDIAGGKADFDHGASLIPVTDRSSALKLISVVTGADVDGAAYRPVEDTARYVDPLGWRFLGVAAVEGGVVSRAGRWRRSTSYVPYARVQSVSACQGPLQRRLGLASVFLDLPQGSQRWQAKHRGLADAASLVGDLGAQARRHRAGLGVNLQGPTGPQLVAEPKTGS
jgi:putative membrane protein